MKAKLRVILELGDKTISLRNDDICYYTKDKQDDFMELNISEHEVMEMLGKIRNLALPFSKE